MAGVGGGGRLRARAEGGQATVEYALVLVAFLAMVLALRALWFAAQGGLLLERAIGSASHQVGAGAPAGSLGEIALFWAGG